MRRFAGMLAAVILVFSMVGVNAAGAGRFGPDENAFDAMLVGQIVVTPDQVPCGGTFSVGLTMWNTGHATWTPGSVHAHIGGFGPAIPVESLGLTSPVGAGEVVSFVTELTAPDAPGDYTIAFRMFGQSGHPFGPTYLATVHVVCVHVAVQLVIGQQPTDATPNVNISPAVTVRIVDASGQLVTDATAAVKVTLNDSNGASLSGTQTEDASGGIATFPDLSVNLAGTAYSLTFASAGLSPVTSDPFAVRVPACTDPPRVGPLSFGVTPPSAGDNGLSAGPYAGDMVTLTAPVSSSCPDAAPLTFAWTLTAPSTSNAQLSSPTAASPSFVADVPAGTDTVTAIATDALGNASAPVTASITASTCGADVPFVSIGDTAGKLPGDPHALVTVVTDTDNDPSACPARLAQTVAYDWSVQPAGSGTFSNASGASTTFTPTATGTAVIKVTVTASPSGQTASTTDTIGVNCTGPSATPFISSINGATNSGQTINVGNLLTFTENTNDTCVSTPTLSYGWQIISQPVGDTTTLVNPTTGTPALTAGAAGTYQIRVAVTDQLNLTSTPRDVLFSVAPGPPIITSPAPGLTTTNPTITVNGTATPNATIRIYDGTLPTATTNADASGNWSAPISVTPGTHTFSATQTVNGQTSTSTTPITIIVV